jgi:hypothetical protein
MSGGYFVLFQRLAETMEIDSSFRVRPRLVVFRSTPFDVDAWRGVGEPARCQGRFHRKGEPLPQYASDSAGATLRELQLHTDSPLEPAREIFRRISAVGLAAGARILAADDAATLGVIGLSLEQVYHPTDYGACQAIADYAKSIPKVAAISTQSNADRLRRTFAILPESSAQLTAEVERWEGSLNLLRLAFDRGRDQPSPSR